MESIFQGVSKVLDGINITSLFLNENFLLNKSIILVSIIGLL